MTSEGLQRSRSGPMDVAVFAAFLQSRPHDEWWQLIDGVAVMMNPPTLAHQRIASNLQTLLNNALSQSGLDMYAYVDTGVRAPGVEKYQPVPDVVVVPGPSGYEVHAERFHLAAEVVSRSNTRKAIDLKLRAYRAAPDNLYVLVIDQRRLSVRVHARRTDWRPVTLSDPDADLALPEFGFRCSVAALYRGTPLAVGGR